MFLKSNTIDYEKTDYSYAACSGRAGLFGLLCVQAGNNHDYHNYPRNGCHPAAGDEHHDHARHLQRTILSAGCNGVRFLR